jgi:hypothetical protein
LFYDSIKRSQALIAYGWIVKLLAFPSATEQFNMDKRTVRLFGFLFGALTWIISIANPALAHLVFTGTAPVLPIHHATLLLAGRPFFKPALLPHAGRNAALTALLTRGSSRVFFTNSINHHSAINLNALLPGPGSLATRNVNALFRSIVENGVKAGEIVPPGGGIVTGGQLQGTLYTVYGPSLTLYANGGAFTAAVGAPLGPGFTPTLVSSLTPGFQNSLTFAPSAPIKVPGQRGGVGGIPIGVLLSRGSSSQRAFNSELFSLSSRSISLGRELGSPISGGIFYGTLYVRILGGSNFISPGIAIGALGPVLSSRYVFAFGNNPLNNPGLLRSLINIPTAPSMITFANGSTFTISSGQLNLPILTPLIPGTFMTSGANPANIGTIGNILTNLNSFVFF